MSSFFNSLADKAQAAINQTPLAGHIPPFTSSSQAHGQQGSSTTDSTHLGGRLGGLQHQLRSLQLQYSTSSTGIQRMITAQKGIALDYDGLSRDSKAHSREIFLWGKGEDSDLTDVSDRLAYLNFMHGSLAGSLAQALDSSRAPLKMLRDAEYSLAPRRNARAALQTQIARIEHDQQRGMEKKLAELKHQFAQAEEADSQSEKDFEILKRKALRESEEQRWAAFREFGEKMVLLAEGSSSIIAALPSIPPSNASPYTGAQKTATTRASLQAALDNFTPGTITHSFQPSHADLSRSESRSFGVTHATELSSIASGDGHPEQGIPSTPSPIPHRPSSQHSVPGSAPSTSTEATKSGTSPSPPINPSALNNTPSPVPPSKHSLDTSATALRVSTDDASSLPSIEVPTVAETGIPVSAGHEGPGPASGSLADLREQKRASTGFAPIPTPIPVPAHETAEEEKHRLQLEEREKYFAQAVHGDAPPSAYHAPPPAVGTSSVGQQKYETAQEEKKRLEREERERLLRGEGSSDNKPGDDTNGPPPYQEF